MANPAIFTIDTAEWSFWQPNTWKVSAFFDVLNHIVYQVDVIDYKNSEHHRWVNPKWKTEYNSNCFDRQLDPIRGENGFDLSYDPGDSPEDLLDLARDLVEGVTYNDDGTVNIPLDLSDDEFLYIAKAAHELDITINEFMTRTIEEHIKQVENDDEY